MTTFEEYARQKKSLASGYELIIASGVLPIGDVTVAQLRERLQNLSDDRFVVAVCGQMNTGKSTLLNALVFQDAILPDAPTVMTAKVTRIEYRESPGLEVEFLNVGDYTALVQELQEKDPAAWETFKAEVDRAAEVHQVRRAEWVRGSGRIHPDALENLPHYVTPVKARKPGKYTPFVKHVTVFHPHPWLKAVTIIDTPGVNDPFRFREDITKRAVEQASAVLFVTYAGQTMSGTDVSFMHEHLVHIPPQRRVIAINKADTEPDRASIESYLRSLQAHPDATIKGVFTGCPIAFVSAVWGLIDAMEAHERPLTERLREKRAEASPTMLKFLDPSHNGVSKLRDIVERQLVKVDGMDRLRAHRDYVRSVATRALKASDRDISGKRTAIDDLNSGIEEHRRKIKDVETSIGKVGKYFDEFARNALKSFEQCKTDFDLTLANVVQAAHSAFALELGSLKDISDIGRKAAWLGKLAWGGQQKTLHTALSRTRAEVERILAAQVTEVAAKLVKDRIPPAEVAAWMDLPAFDMVVETRNRLANALERNAMSQSIEGRTTWLDRLVDSEGGLKAGREEALGAFELWAHEVQSSTTNTVAKEAQKAIQSTRSSLESEIQEAQARRRTELEELMQDRLSRETRLAQARSELATLEKHRSRIEALRDQLDAGVPDVC